MLTLLAATVALLWLSSRIPSCAGDHATRIVSVLVWLAGLMVSSMMLLSLPRLLTGRNLVFLLLFGCGIAYWLLPRPQRAPNLERGDSVQEVPERLGVGSWSAIVILGVLLLVSVATVLGTPEQGEDVLGYHLPRLGYWLRDRAIHAFQANNPRIGSFPHVGDALSLFPVLFLHGDRLCGLVQILSAFGTGIAIYGLSRNLGSSREASCLTALAWFAVPSVLRQLPSSMVDLTGAFFVAAALHLAMASEGCTPDRRMPAAGTALLALALAVGAKPQNGIIALAVAPVCVMKLRRSGLDLPAAGLLASVAAVGVAPFWIENTVLFRNPVGPEAVAHLLLHPTLPNMVKNAVLFSSPLLPWLYDSRAATDLDFSYQGLYGAATQEGMGVVWLPLLIVSTVLWLPRARRQARRTFVVATGWTTLLLTLLLMRHQVALVRFVLPATTLISQSIPPLLDSFRRWPWLSTCGKLLLASTSAFVILTNARDVLVWRLSESARQAFFESRLTLNTLRSPTEHERYPPEFRAAARLLDGAGGLRVGLLTGQSAPERLAFGGRFQNEVIPVSYRLPMDEKRFRALHLDALLFIGSGRCRVELYRSRLERRPNRLEEGYRVESFRGFDRGFATAVGDIADYPDVCTALRFIDEHWHVADWSMQGSTGRFVLLQDSSRSARSARTVEAGKPLYVTGQIEAPGDWIVAADSAIEGTSLAASPEGYFLVPVSSAALIPTLRARPSEGAAKAEPVVRIMAQLGSWQ